jgi:hypothetical protein
MTKQSSSTGGLVLPVVIIGVLFLLILAGLCWLAWRLTASLEPVVLRAWALLATIAIPLALWLGYRLGHTEARGRLQGIDDGLGRVTAAAATVIDLRGQASQRLREPTQPPVDVELPKLPQFTVRALNAGEIVELD